MMSVEIRGGGGEMVAGGGGGIDPSNLHLKKELTQIRRAARVLRDPGTSSSWRSPVNSARSLTKNHYVQHHKNGLTNGNAVPSSSEKFLRVENNTGFSNANGISDKGNASLKEKEKRVFLYNWRSQKSESERSRQIGEDDVENGKDEGSSSTHENSVDVDSLSDARNGGGNDSKSESCLSDRYASAIFKCKGANFTPSIKRTIKKKPKRSSYSNASLRPRKGEQEKQMLLNRRAKNVVDGLPGIGLERDDLVGLVDQSDGAEDYSNSEDLRRAAAISPLLARIRNKGWAHSSAKFLRTNRKDEDSVTYSTPALSTSSYNKYAVRNPSMVESWDATTGSFNDADDEVDDQLDLPGRQGCGIPCYWSRRSTPKSRIGYGSCSPSLSDTLLRKGSSILCGSQGMHQRRHNHGSLGSKKRRLGSKAAAQGLVPLLTSSGDGRGGSSMGSRASDDEVSVNFPELDLEALSRLDGRRWSSSCRSQDGLELVAMNGEVQEDSSPENGKSLSQKYRPMFFEELIGQNIVVQSLINAIARRRIAPLYLFQGPRGTGKTATARIFSASLNCLAAEETKPCGVCRECANFVSGKSKCFIEVDGSNKKGINKIKNLLKNLSLVHQSSHQQYRVFVVDECHLLPSKTWLSFLRLLEKPMPRVVFVLITTDIDNVPRTILSRCQKHLFNKISNADIVIRLRKIASDENLDVESDALELIALNAEGSLRDAETMLDQLSLFGKRITMSLVNELIGVVSDEKLLDLLELAMSSNATETVIRARELLDSGVDPIVLMSQMATLIVDIIAGTYPSSDARHNDSFFGGRNLSERELDRLKHALSLLSEAEKHLRVSSERSTWFTATLLQLGSLPSPDQTHSGSSRRQNSKATEEDRMSILREATAQKQRTDAQFMPERSRSPTPPQLSSHQNSASQEILVSSTDAASFGSNPNNNQFMNGEAMIISHEDSRGGRTALRCANSDKLNDIWVQCIEKCHSKTLRQLLHSYAKLASISEVKGGFVAHIAFTDGNVKSRAEGFLSSITNSFEIVLRRNVEVRIILVPESLVQRQTDKKTVTNLENASVCSNIALGYSGLDLRCEPLEASRGNLNLPNEMGPAKSKNGNTNSSKDRIPVQRIESIIREQRLETAWLQAMEKGTPGSMSRLKPERNQILPQDGMGNPHEMDSTNLVDMPLQHWEDDLNREIKALKISDGTGPPKDQTVKRVDHYPISPSLLHNSSFTSNFTKDNMGYESGTGASGCSGMFCWNSKPPRRPKAKQGTPVRSRKNGRFSWFGECAKSRRTENRHVR